MWTDSELILIRHGRGHCNDAGVIGGDLGCSGLTEHGRQETQRLAERLAVMQADRPISVLFSSPRLRVLECAQIIGARLGVPVTVMHALAGQEFGTADGRSWHQVTSDFGGPPAHDPYRPIAEGAEPWNAYADRVLAALTTVLTDYSGQRICLVGHGKTTGLAAALLSGAADPATIGPDLVIDHGAMSVWRPAGERWKPFTHNNSRHLNADHEF